MAVMLQSSLPRTSSADEEESGCAACYWREREALFSLRLARLRLAQDTLATMSFFNVSEPRKNSSAAGMNRRSVATIEERSPSA